MRKLYPQQTHILPLNTIRRERMLPWQGEVLVTNGQDVGPSDVVARAGRPRPRLILDVAQKLGVPRTQAEKYYLKRAGDAILQGEPLAKSRSGLLGTRKIVSPVEGRVAAIKAGKLIIDPRPELFELRALLSGVVVDMTPGFGVVIETPGALLQGAWGSGQEGYGVLKLGVERPDAVIDEEEVDASYHGSVLVCGATLTMAVLSKAQEMQARGLIVGAVPAGLQEAIYHQPLPVIATEGIGRIPISEIVFSLLQANEGREMMVSAVIPSRWRFARPEIIVPLPASTQLDAPPPPGTPLSEGLKVRIKRAPLMGVVGTVQRVYGEPRAVENGVRCPGADVVLNDGTTVFVPHVNLDLVGLEKQ